ncbi:hypothetical protein S40288_08451 [Stachybotrys chartarum IBT 40288]|nr:hypothetical protein S40288_08451 [Stachybotrys chartarum IBT 40288]
MASSKPWVDGPFKLVPPSASGDTKEKPVEGARKLAAEMSIAHNCLLRGANAIYLQCVNVAANGTPKDKVDFANFARQWTEMVQEHHNLEENNVFPQINDLTEVPNLMDENVEEHRLFHEGFDALVAYLDKVKAAEEELSDDKVRSILDEFMPTLQVHLTNEIGTLVRLEVYNDKVDWAKWFNELVSKTTTEYMKDIGYRQRMLPLAFLFHDKTYQDGIWGNFPPVPWLIKVVLKWMYLNRHADWWRFAGCDLDSAPRDLPFV